MASKVLTKSFDNLYMCQNLLDELQCIPDQTPRSVVSDLGIHCLLVCFRVSTGMRFLLMLERYSHYHVLIVLKWPKCYRQDI